jgi:2-polyprenyl-3-methyl-5-hydroxy-6-metoxy-1,4-benzoquinol methylase
MQTKSKPSINHHPAYDNYYSTHFSNYQDLNPDGPNNFYQENYLKYLPIDKNASILEIGSGLGKFAYYLKKSGYSNITCIDISSELVLLAKIVSNIDVQLVDEPMDFLAKCNSKYDFVIMLDVIEHIRKETIIDYLDLVRLSLKSGGELLVTTENMSSPIGGRIQHYLDFTHEYNYSEFSLEQVLSISGFSLIQINGIVDKFVFQPKAALLWIFRHIWFHILGVIYKAERPGSRIPKIFGKELVAIAKV